jgi:uncharacterized membrane protein
MFEKNIIDTLEKIPANRSLVEDLYSHGKITQEERKYALKLLYPPHEWALWISNLLRINATVLILVGTVLFFVFNWSLIPQIVILLSLQCAIITCIVGAYIYSLKRINGQILLLSGTFLVGVFMLIFGKYYQTGVETYTFFMMWSLLTLGWTLLSNFPAQWILWLIITNIFLMFWWKRKDIPPQEIESLMFFSMIILNGAASTIWEYVTFKKNDQCIKNRWGKFCVFLLTLYSFLMSVSIWIYTDIKATKFMIISGIISLMGHGIFYYWYRYKSPHVWAMGATILSMCVILDSLSFKILSHMGMGNALKFFFMGIITLTVFFCAFIVLRTFAKKKENRHGQIYEKT